MEKKRILKAFYILLSLPQVGASILIEVFITKSLRTDLDNCLMLVSKYASSIPHNIIDALIIAEDHRNTIHPGIDVIAMIRALWIQLTTGKTQGASTIEQQYVRVVSNRYERTVSRKLREQMLALILVRHVEKRAIASAYLAIAFYGSGSIGIKGLKSRLGDDLSNVSLFKAIQIVAQLKYPRPMQPDKQWFSKHYARINTLMRRKALTSNKYNNQSIRGDGENFFDQLLLPSRFSLVSKNSVHLIDNTIKKSDNGV